MRNLGIVKSSEKLRKLILENPELPIAVLAGETAWDGDHRRTYCGNVKVSIDEILDADILDSNESIFCDREDLENYLQYNMGLDPDYDDLSDEEFYKKVEAEMGKYEPYWKKVICIWADN